MQHGITQVLSLLIVYYLPIDNEIIKMQVGILLSGMLYNLMDNKYHEKLLKYFWRKKTHVIINEKINNKSNPIYNKFEDYIIEKYVSNINSCELIPKKGDIIFQINNNDFKDKIIDKYNDKEVYISFSNGSDKVKNSKENNSVKVSNKSVYIESKYINQEELKSYVVNICNFEKTYTNILQVWRASIEKFGKSEVVNWEETKCQTNKTYQNTIVSESVNKNFFEDIKWFLENESWFAAKGLPYKRGYILHGPPGTGKTSLIKTIANECNLPVFTLDFETVKTNDDLMKLMGELNILSQNRKFILSLEDVDRSPLFGRGYYNECRVTKDCLLNVLDGIMESYGRIVIMTCNDLSILKSIPAFHRPGRIDKCILITYCDKTQVKRLIKNFYDQDLDESLFTNINNLTPADLIKMMQENPNDCEFILNNINNSRESKKMNYNFLKPEVDKKEQLKKKIREAKKRLKNTVTSIKKQTVWEEKRKNKILHDQEQIPKLEEKLKLEIEKEKLKKEKEKEKLKKEKEKEKLKKEKEKLNLNKEKKKEKPNLNKEKKKEKLKKEKEKDRTDKENGKIKKRICKNEREV